MGGSSSKRRKAKGFYSTNYGGDRYPTVNEVSKYQQDNSVSHPVNENEMMRLSSVMPMSYRVTEDIFNSGKFVVAIYDYQASGKDDLHFRKGDRLFLLDDRHSDWWFARNIRTHEIGYIPSSYVSSIDDLKTKEWYFHNVNLRDAERILDQPNNVKGTFLIRPSGSTQGNFALSMLDIQNNDQYQVKHYRIRRTDDGRFYIGPKVTFPNLQKLVDYYSGKYRGRDVAVKTTKTNKKTSGGDFLEEARVMKDLNHPNIVRLYGVSTVAEPYYIVVEFMINGNLLTYLRSDMGQALKLPKLVDVAAQVAKGMSYLEKRQLVHCDLAARNILVGESLHVKIGDFGLARMIRSGKLQVESQTQFPIKWTAPEAATKKEYTIKSDVWSFGILLYELITKGSVPYPAMSNQETLQAVSQGYRLPKPALCPDSFYSVMTRCWNSNPDSRPTFDYLFNLFDDFFVTTEPNYRESEDI